MVNYKYENRSESGSRIGKIRARVFFDVTDYISAYKKQFPGKQFEYDANGQVIIDASILKRFVDKTKRVLSLSEEEMLIYLETFSEILDKKVKNKMLKMTKVEKSSTIKA